VHKAITVISTKRTASRSSRQCSSTLLTTNLPLKSTMSFLTFHKRWQHRQRSLKFFIQSKCVTHWPRSHSWTQLTVPRITIPVCIFGMSTKMAENVFGCAGNVWWSLRLCAVLRWVEYVKLTRIRCLYIGVYSFAFVTELF
jgi:hypothetical protein